MKVKELIGHLEALNPEQEVLLPGYEGGYYNSARLREAVVALNWYEQWYYGPHEVVDDYLKQDAKESGRTFETEQVYILS